MTAELAGRRIAITSMLVSAGLAAAKIAVGLQAGSTATVSDGIESAGDVLASGLVLLGLIIAAKPADAEHPYGHGRLETLSALAVGMLLAATGVLISFESLHLSRDTKHTPAAYAVWPLAASIAIKAILSVSKRQYGRKIQSSGLVADAWNDTVDILSGTIALLGLGLTLLAPDKFALADRMGGSAVGVIVVFLGVRVVRDTVVQLMDTMPDLAAMARIRTTGLTVPGVLGIEKCFARKTGLKWHVDLHLEVDPGMTVFDSHEIATHVKEKIRAEVDWVADVLVHVEPYMLATISNGPRAASNSPRAAAQLGRTVDISRMENREFARVLAETADLMEIAGEDGFRIRSYRNAASAIEGFAERVDDILANPTRKVTEIPGVGKGLAGVIAELAQRGSFEKRDTLLAQFPPTLLELFKIQGLGPKGIALVYQHHKVATIDELERICKEQKLRELPRMGAKLEEKVLKSIAQYRQRTGRFLLNFGQKIAGELIPYLSETGGIEKIAAAGSLRRGKETIGDLDLLVTGSGAAAALERFVTHPKAHSVLGKGPNKASVQYGLDGIQVDLRALPHESYGAAMQYFTGSKEHNILLRSRALKLGLTLNEYGLFQLDNDTRVAGETEEEVYAALGLAWIPPELRENCGEIEAAIVDQTTAGRLPKLIELADIRGDLHMHTTETDGRATLQEMAEAAHALGYEYIAITDHSKALAMANGLDETRAVAFARQVRDLNRSGLPLRIFSGLECDIRRDGAMDLAEDALAELDIVVGSVHSHMNLEAAEMTDRLMRALESPSLRVMGHPTGRMLLNRDPFPFDFERVASQAARRNVYLEINGSPERLDLSGAMVRTAKALGCKFAISTDAHQTKHLGINMPFGVLTARRGWLEARDVLNALPLAEFETIIRKS